MNAYEKSRPRLLKELISVVGSLGVSDALRAIAGHYQDRANSAAEEGARVARRGHERNREHADYERLHATAASGLRDLIRRIETEKGE